MLNGVHILLTYTCLYQCEHCFLHCGPGSGGSFTFSALQSLLYQAAELGTVRRIAFEGGEPFLMFPLLQEGIRQAHSLGFETEVVSNGYWVQDPEDARRWLAPLKEAGLDILDISCDSYHNGENDPGPGPAAELAAQELGLAANIFVIDPPVVREDSGNKGDPIVGGGVRFRGRAAEELVRGLPLTDNDEFTSCPDEDLESPGRVHVDAFGNVQLCQGISIGNCWQRPLRELLDSYDPRLHPVCGPLLTGGPARLAREYDITPAPVHVDACHLCYAVRKTLRQRLPDTLSPSQAYGE